MCVCHMLFKETTRKHFVYIRFYLNNSAYNPPSNIQISFASYLKNKKRLRNKFMRGRWGGVVKEKLSAILFFFFFYFFFYLLYIGWLDEINPCNQSGLCTMWRSKASFDVQFEFLLYFFLLLLLFILLTPKTLENVHFVHLKEKLFLFFFNRILQRISVQWIFNDGLFVIQVELSNFFEQKKKKRKSKERRRTLREQKNRRFRDKKRIKKKQIFSSNERWEGHSFWTN